MIKFQSLNTAYEYIQGASKCLQHFIATGNMAEAQKEMANIEEAQQRLNTLADKMFSEIASEKVVVKVVAKKKYVVINEGISGSQHVTRVEVGRFIQRDGLLIEITGTERVTEKTVRIYGRYIDSGEAYSENKRSHTIIQTYARNNIRMAM